MVDYERLQLNHIYHGPALDVLKTFEPESIDLVVTSPPYYNLRDYQSKGQIGMEKTPQEYIQNLVEVFAECKRVLKKNGSIWVNIGDTYASGGGKAVECSFVRKSKSSKDDRFSPDYPAKAKLRSKMGKSLLAIPERLAIALTDDLRLIRRNTIIWHKGNCMPSSIKDRFTIDFEYFYFFTKSQRYFFETQYEPLKTESLMRYNYGFGGSPKFKQRADINKSVKNTHHYFSEDKLMNPPPSGRIKRTVWKINPQPFSEAHFAVFPEKLVETPIKACCPPSNGTVLDPFMGSGTVGVVAKKQRKNYVGIELSEEYIRMAEKRIKETAVNEKLI